MITSQAALQHSIDTSWMSVKHAGDSHTLLAVL